MRVAACLSLAVVVLAGAPALAEDAAAPAAPAPAAAQAAAPAAVDTRARYLDRADRQFKRLDPNGDGVITRDEVDAAADAIAKRIRARMARSFAQADADGDGKETAVEYRAVAERRFKRLDGSAEGRARLDRMLKQGGPAADDSEN